MGILNRISTIARANINALLDQAEDPAKMLDQLIRDMRDGIAEARTEVAKMIADEKELQANAERSQQLADEWQAKAELAIQKGAEDLAREALRRKIDYANNAKVYHDQWLAQHQAVEKAKADLHELEEKYESALRNREVLLARHRRAQAQQQVAKVSATLSSFDPTSELSRMEERIRLEEARASAQIEIQRDTTEDRFAQLSADSEVEAELAKLKTKISAPPQIAAPAGTDAEPAGDEPSKPS
ncbi:MAG TPA: PspA/IM30 family protein [Chloroflexota bacterium]|nr:PspA/IM30 family protein [Chloroflexota bacterium]